MPNWKTLSIGKTSEELVDILINEIIHGNTIDNNNSEYFTMMIKKSNVFKFNYKLSLLID